MAPSRVIVLGIAAVAAVGAGLVARNMTATPPPEVVVQAAPSEPAMRVAEVLVVTGDVRMGTSLGEHIAWQRWPTDGIQDYFITRESEPDAIDRLRTSVARVPLYAGEPLRPGKLIGEGKSFMATILPTGKRAIATQISASTSAGGFILPDDRVDVIMTRRSQDSNVGEGFVTETILKNIRVLAIDQTIQEDEEGRRVRVGDTATLELSPQQAEIITVAQQMADRLTLALRPVVDAQEQVDQGADYLVSGTGRRGTVRVIRSGEISEIGAR
jgi:pilus assembly protein CpaB